VSRNENRPRLTDERGDNPAKLEEPDVPTITPFLWFDTQAEEAMHFYASIFERSRVLSVSRAHERVMSVTFELEGQKLMALNAGPHHTFNEAVSFFVGCETQEEIDRLWDKLSADGGSPGRCGWLKDKFGLSWQVIPNALGPMLSDRDPGKAKRTLDAMLQMDKLDLAKLRAAHSGS
jgi:predicted 3-demethylubiquinone-9 3-methyltransferase (glyoxalase superfamily)